MRLFEVISPREKLSESNSETVVFTFGRFQPPTTGHQKLVQKVQSVAAANNADHIIFLSQTHKPGKDPLSWPDKISIFKKAFPDVNVSTDKDVRNPFGALETLGKTYDNIIMVVGSDRVERFKTDMSKYTEEFGIKNFDVISAGQRDPDSEGITGVAASKLRALAVEGSFPAFAKALPSTLSVGDKRSVYRLIRQNS